MKKIQPLFQWLALAALGEWLLGRTLTRAAIHMPKTPAFISAYTAVNQMGQVLATFVALLALVLLVWILWQAGPINGLSLVLAGLIGLSLLFLWLVPPVWLALVYQLLAITAVGLIGVNWIGRAGTARLLLVWLFPALTLLAGLLVQLLPTVYALLSWPGPPPLSGLIFRLGEGFVITSVGGWWWVYGRERSWRIWLRAALPALLFALSFHRDPAMTGILTIWSTGLTLFLPWPLYAVALWLAGMTVLAAWHRQPAVAYAILLLISAGYAPQLSSQLFCALIGLWLLARARPVPHSAPSEAGHLRDPIAPVAGNAFFLL